MPGIRPRATGKNMKHEARERPSHGFTLIELLVVIAIIAILAAILFPVFARVRERGRISACLSNCKQISAATLMYVDDNRGRLPKAKYFGRVWYMLQVSTNPAQVDNGPYIQDLQHPYVKNSKVWLCPSLSPTGKFSKNPDATASYNMALYSPTDNRGSSRNGSDAYSNYMWVHYRYSKGVGNVDPSHSLQSGALASDMIDSSQVIIFMEFPYWAPSPHRVSDTKGFHVADTIAYYDGHVKLIQFPDHAWGETWRGWEL